MTEVLLDTGSNRTLVWEDLVSRGKAAEEEVMVCCAHGDLVSYPVADVEIEIGELRCTVRAGISKTLPVPVLLGNDRTALHDSETGRVPSSNSVTC